MTTFLFVRHGETDWNREGRFQGSRDIPLNVAGRQQARRLAARWNLGGDLVLTSPLSRARETAELLATTVGLELRGTDERLVERHYGQGEGLTLAERKERFPDGVIPGIESPETIQKRAWAFLDAMTLEHPGRTLVVVSHGGFINAVLSVASRGEVGTGKTLLGNASVSRVDYSASGWTVAFAGRTFEEAPLGLRE